MGRPVAGPGGRRMGNHKAAVKARPHQFGDLLAIAFYIERVGRFVRIRQLWRYGNDEDPRMIVRSPAGSSSTMTGVTPFQPAHAGDIGAETNKLRQHAVARRIIANIGE